MRRFSSLINRRNLVPLPTTATAQQSRNKSAVSTTKAASVVEAITSRRSIRKFLPDPVSVQLVGRILKEASRAPSGGNLQPWQVYVLSGSTKDRLISAVASQMEAGRNGENKGPPYLIYPPELTEPFRTRRRVLGADLYHLIGIPKSDQPAKLRQLAKNYTFFGAPVGLIIVIDKQMNEPQWSDVGMFLQNVMLLARQYGLHTCAQEAWANYHKTIHRICNVPENLTVFCGMAIGYVDPDAIINQLDTERVRVKDFVTFCDVSENSEEMTLLSKL
uniref:NADH dehydrogenase n=2 Tax=Hirondellea gigas TaxID=1518452 RepID=A0A6A7GF29_9CRUS